jgi:hypothetical protein
MQEYIKQNFFYDPYSGNVIALFGRKKGKRVGWVNEDGYSRLRLPNGKQIFGHILAWIYMVGEAPSKQVDHINHNKSCNKWCNLREATHAENQLNQFKAQKNSQTGLRGVSLDKGKYKAKIKINGEVYMKSGFETPEEAHEWYLSMKKKLHTFAYV